MCFKCLCFASDAQKESTEEGLRNINVENVGEEFRKRWGGVQSPVFVNE